MGPVLPSTSLPLAFLALALAASRSFAAGGHHAVDDATIADPDQCQLETWADAYRGARASWHFGPACRVGNWELGVNADKLGVPGEPQGHTLAPQGKWVAVLTPTLSAGIVFTGIWAEGRYASFQPLVPVTWQPDPKWLVHLNVGRDIPRQGGGRNLAGAAVEWAPAGAWSFVAERFNDVIGRAARLGVRWQPDPLFSIDISQARSFGDARGRWWTVGATYVVERK
jgi:hypothetical protein